MKVAPTPVPKRLDRERDLRMTWAVIRGAALVALLAGGLAGIVASPLLFRGLSRYTTGWGDMASVGDAYGGIAALLSGLALGGIVVSLLVQWRHSYSDRMVAIRQHHFELVKMGLDHPSMLDRAAGSGNRETLVGQIHANLWVSHWAMLWDLRYCDEQRLRHLVAQLFDADAVSREWWQADGSTWSALWNRRRRRFQAIVSDECRLAIMRAEAAAPRAGGTGTRESSAAQRQSRSGAAAVIAVGALACGALAAVLWARRKAVVNAALDLGDERLPGARTETQDVNGILRIAHRRGGVSQRNLDTI